QPISALEHPSFRKMINIAALAMTNGVKIPSRKYTHTLIIDMFREHMIKLQSQLLVSKNS
ncbi:hypothetical protein J3R82DRAFT_3287, partial [Butyriboletus roseoflavus]